MNEDFLVQGKYYKSFFEQKKNQRQGNGVLIRVMEISYLYQRIRTIIFQVTNILRNLSSENIAVFNRLRFDSMHYLAFDESQTQEFQLIEKTWKADNVLIKSLFNIFNELMRIKSAKNFTISGSIQKLLNYVLEISDYV